MRRFISFALLTTGILSSCFPAVAQEKSDPPKEEAKSGPHESIEQLQVKVMYTEYEGDKKVKSFPFAMLVSTRNGPPSEINVGARIPIVTSAEASASQYQYISVATDVTCRARPVSVGLYALVLNFERSWVEGSVSVPVQKVPGPPLDNSSVGRFAQPIIHRFQSMNDITMRDGQTFETIVGTDPASGKVGKLEISMTVIK